MSRQPIYSYLPMELEISEGEINRLRHATLDDILSRLHRYQSRSKPSRGYNSKALVCGDFRTSRQYDYENGAIDAENELSEMRAVEFQVNEMDEPFRTAIHKEAQRLHIGRAVIRSPRFGLSDGEWREKTILARRIIIKRLISAGVMC